MVAIDDLKIFELREDPDTWERLIEEQWALAEHDRAAAAVVEAMYLERDRDAAFERYLSSLELSRLLHLLRTFGVRGDDDICEIGGGSGVVAWALNRSGFPNVSLLEPNPHFVTGTGYLKSRAEARAIETVNDLSDWYASPKQYAVILTRNCVHHFPNIAMAAAAIRKKMKAGALWFMVQEWFADTPAELYERLGTHPYSQKYGLYEFPFPASHYVEATEIAGFRLIGVVPALYANDALGENARSEGSAATQRFTRRIDAVLRRAPSLTVRAYAAELFCNRYFGRRYRRFTRPQVMVFRKAEITPPGGE
jgi:hypothetical protein